MAAYYAQFFFVPPLYSGMMLFLFRNNDLWPKISPEQYHSSYRAARNIGRFSMPVQECRDRVTFHIKFKTEELLEVLITVELLG